MRRRDVVAGMAALAGAACASRGAGGSRATMEDAFLYGFPLYEIARTGQNRAQTVGLNRMGHRAVLLDHTSRMITAPNNDTIYSSAQLELSGGPVEVVTPTDLRRYFSIAFMDAFTDNFAYIGTRATGGRGGRFWVVGPQWSGRTPDGVMLIRSSTNDVWMLGRILVDGPEDLAAAKALQDQITIQQVSGEPRPFGVTATHVEDPANFLGVVNDMLVRSPGGLGQTARASRFASLGFGAPASADLMAAWRSFIPGALEELREGFLFRELVVDGWSYQPQGVGNFGENDRLRSIVALGGLAALGEEEAMYFHANFEPDGTRLNGAHSYMWRVPAGGVPADAFWSLTCYQAEADGRYFLVDNPIRRYAIGNRTPGLVVNPDGSFDIYIQRERPEREKAANWLPAPEGPMRLALRAYLPRAELRERRWTVPPLRRAA